MSPRESSRAGRVGRAISRRSAWQARQTSAGMRGLREFFKEVATPLSAPIPEITGAEVLSVWEMSVVSRMLRSLERGLTGGHTPQVVERFLTNQHSSLAASRVPVEVLRSVAMVNEVPWPSERARHAAMSEVLKPTGSGLPRDFSARLVDASAVSDCLLAAAVERVCGPFRTTDGAGPIWRAGIEEAGRTSGTAAYGAEVVAGLTDEGEMPYMEWVAVGDARTRPSHLEADGQVVPVGSPFTVGGALMNYPADPGGPSEEVDNCRCIVVGTFVAP